MATLNQLRQRRKRKDGSETKKSPEKRGTVANDGEGNEVDQVLSTSPARSSYLGKILIFLPYILVLLPIAYWRVIVQHAVLRYPEVTEHVLAGVKLRPKVTFSDERQVLIVGTMSAGTKQTATDLERRLELEVGHERTDAMTDHIRDGSVSWFHGIRFFPPVEEAKSTFIQSLCHNFVGKMGFHPRQYRGGVCSEWLSWSDCWEEECQRILDAEYGCARSPDGCTMPFRRTLHQVRNPRSVVESLVAKYCNATSLRMENDWIRFHNMLFGGLKQRDFGNLNCIEAVSYYVMDYTNILIKAREDGLINVRYTIEKKTPCDIAEMAGFRNHSDNVWKPNYAKVQRWCSDTLHIANQPMKSTRNKVNSGKVRLDWSDFEGGKHGSSRPAGDISLMEAMRNFSVSLGYDPDKRPQSWKKTRQDFRTSLEARGEVY